MALLKVRRFSQVTLPASVRKRFPVKEGDYLEAQVVEEGILLKPVAVVDREQAWKDIFSAMSSVKRLKPGMFKSSREEDEWITKQVKAMRRQRPK